jgi:alpha-L-rhamnosidase
MTKTPTIVMAILMISFAISGFTGQATGADLKITGLKTEYHTNPIGIDQTGPRFFWVIESTEENTLQTAYHLQVSSGADFTRRENLTWDTGKAESSQSIHVEYSGRPLQSSTRYYWRVKTWDNHGNESDWSETSYFEMGLLSPTDWKAQWIESVWEEDKTTPQPAHMLRKEFNLRREIQSARIYTSSHGLYELEINGQRVGDHLFTPGWTSFNNRVQYQTYDITDLLKRGTNAIGVHLGDGWYRGFIGWGTQRNYYGETLAFIGQIVITYTNGRTDIIGTDNTWRSTTGPIRYSDIYNGEKYDARLEKPGWSIAGYNDRDWQRVRVANISKNKLIAPQAPPVMKIQELKPVEMLVTPEGDTVLDMGQNMIGWMKIRVNGPAGTSVKLRHAETLDKYGNFYTENLRSADQTNIYILKGEGTEKWEPRFTFQGFRYVAVSGWPGEINPDDFTGVVIHSYMEPTGHFDCSHPMVNRLQHNIVWGQKGNFLDVPTDCPQRDERMGWTGDIQVFANTANINMNTASFLTRWLGDLEADQLENGAVTHVVPDVLNGGSGAAGWADASTVVPWSLYQSFGDERVLARQYNSMKAWVNFMKERAATAGDPFVWDTDWHFGDWLSFATLSHPNYPGAYTDIDLIATAYFARSTSLTLEVARLLNKTEDVNYYSQLLQNVKASFQKEFLTPRGRLSSDTQTAYLLALRYDLLPKELRQRASEYLLRNVRSRGHLTTGFLGTPHLNHALSEFGYKEDAYNLLLRKEYPSWLYPVTMGATTIWERWDGIKTDSTFQSPSMNSFNHYAYGAIGEWLFREVAGIKNATPGYKQILIHPNPGGGLTHARAIQKTLYGRLSSEWAFEDGSFMLEVTVPANTTAQVVLPYAATVQVLMNGISLNMANQRYAILEDNVIVYLGSGTYHFSYPSGQFPESALPGNDDTKDVTFDRNSLVAGFAGT